MPYKDKEQQRAAIKAATQRYRLKRKGITADKGITPECDTVIPCDTNKPVIPSDTVIPVLTPQPAAVAKLVAATQTKQRQPVTEAHVTVTPQPVRQPLTKEQQVKGFYR